MIIFWGTKTKSESLGFAADHCEHCNQVTPFLMEEHFEVGHLYWIPMGSWKLKAVTRACQSCSWATTCDPESYDHLLPKNEAVTMNIDQLAMVTNRPLYQLHLQNPNHKGDLPLFDPKDPRAIEMKAKLLIKEGRAEEAESLMVGMDPHSPTLLELGKTYHSQKKYDKALASLTRAQLQTPRLGQDKQFRMLVKELEKDTGVPSSQLPMTTAFKKLILFSIIILAGVFSISLLAYYSYNNQTLYVVNGWQESIELKIDDGDPIQINGSGFREISVSPGKHVAHLIKPHKADTPMVIETGFWAGVTTSKFYVLDVTRSAILISESEPYSERPQTINNNRYRFKVFYDKPFRAFSKIDYPFRPFPKKVSISGSRKLVWKTRLSQYEGSAEDLYLALTIRNQWANAWKFAEWHLDRNPENDRLVYSYAQDSKTHQRVPTAIHFLEKGCSHRPVNIDWHRAYQNLTEGHEKALGQVAYYDGLLEKDPKNSSLNYLRARLSPTIKESKQFCLRALEGKKDNAWACYSLGYLSISEGNWERAAQNLKKACDLRPDMTGFQTMLHSVHLLTDRTGGEEQKIRQNLKASPLDYSLNDSLLSLLIHGKRKEEAFQHFVSFEKRFLREVGMDVRFMIRNMKARANYGFEMYEPLDFEVSSATDLEGKEWYAISLLEQGKLTEACKIISDLKDPYLSLAASLNWQGSNTPVKAILWENQALEHLAKGPPQDLATRAILQAKEKPSMDNILDLNLLPSKKCILMIYLAKKHTPLAGMLLKEAKKLSLFPNLKPRHWIHKHLNMAK